MVKVITIGGAGLGDNLFSIETPREGEVIWNVTRIQAAADAGKFGPPIRQPMSIVPPADFTKGFLDRAKIERYKMMPEVLAKPALAIEAPEPGHIMCFCDGQHRLTALQQLKASHFLFFLVPTGVERQYRVSEQHSDVEAYFPADHRGQP